MRRRRLFLVILLTCLMATGCEGSWSSGDRVLVSKYSYDTGITPPNRWDVVVFKWPKEPVQKGAPKNYIKRLLGLPGELLAILFGRIYVATVPPNYDDSGVPELERWEARHMNRGDGARFLNPSDGADRSEWDKHKFEIERKPLATLLAMRRPVNDNDYQPKDLQGNKDLLRWAGTDGGAWAPDGENKVFRNDGSGQGVDWLHYRHRLRPPALPKEQLITDFEAYNHYTTGFGAPHSYEPGNWVGDLMLECKLKVEEAKGLFLLELSKGVDRFQAVWDLKSGECTLYRVSGGNKQELDRKATDLKAAGEYDLRIANVDARLTVWVNGSLPFGNGHEYREPDERGPQANDLQPASIGAAGAKVEVRHLKLWRDTYYTAGEFGGRDKSIPSESYYSPEVWGELRTRARLLYVEPGHYLCMGDNSPQSSDSREWGLVPQRLMLGRALLVYYPFGRAGRIK